MSDLVPLSLLQVGNTCIIDTIHASEHMRRRLLDLGFSKGTLVKCIQYSPYGDPIAYMIRGTVIALRKEDACQILVQLGGDVVWD